MNNYNHNQMIDKNRNFNNQMNQQNSLYNAIGKILTIKKS